jgi:hypothetical protein
MRASSPGPAVIIGEGRPGPDDPVLIQVSRWDRLKDMAGVLRGFADHVAPGGQLHLKPDHTFPLTCVNAVYVLMCLVAMSDRDTRGSPTQGRLGQAFAYVYCG